MNEQNSHPKDDSNEVINAVLEWTKQITTLASGTLVLSATFIKDIFKGTVEHQILLICSWVLFAVSAIFGILLMGNLCYLFSEKNRGIRSIYNLTTRLIGLIHFLAFVVGICFFVYFASSNFLNKTKQMGSTQTTPPKIEQGISGEK